MTTKPTWVYRFTCEDGTKTPWFRLPFDWMDETTWEHADLAQFLALDEMKRWPDRQWGIEVGHMDPASAKRKPLPATVRAFITKKHVTCTVQECPR
jgi:hypothetical protein